MTLDEFIYKEKEIFRHNNSLNVIASGFKKTEVLPIALRARGGVVVKEIEYTQFPDLPNNPHYPGLYKETISGVPHLFVVGESSKNYTGWLPVKIIRGK